MSYTMTYDSLLVDIRRYLERGFTAESDQIVYEQLPRLITLAQRRIARELKIQGFIRPVQTNLQIGVAVYPLLGHTSICEVIGRMRLRLAPRNSMRIMISSIG